MNNLPSFRPRLAPLLFLLLTQCARSETVDEPAQPKPVAVAPAPAPAAPGKPNLGKDDVAAPAVRVPIDGLPAFGPANAPVTVVAFTDYECPYCAKADDRFAQLKTEYGDKLRIVVASHPLPMHDHAAPAARAFLAAVEQGKGEAMHARLFAMNAASTTMDDAGLRAAATEVGLDLAAFDRARTGSSTAEALKQAETLGAKLGVEGTPTFFVNGRRLVGARPIDAFRALVDEELANARTIEARGVGRDGVYGRLLATLPEAAPVKADLGDVPDQVFDIDLAEAPVRGARRAPVTVVLFSDFECPFCVKAEATLRQLEAQKQGQIRIVYKQRPLPMHSHARLAAKASLAAERQGKFWEYHDVLVDHRKELEREDLIKYAVDLGLSRARFEKDLDDPAIEERIKADEKQADKLDVKGTPTAFVNGRKIIGAQPLLRWIALAEHP